MQVAITGAGKKEGVKLTIFNYSGCFVVGLNKWLKVRDTELKRVIGMKGAWANHKNGYKDRYPDTWEEEVDKKLLRSGAHLVSVNLRAGN